MKSNDIFDAFKSKDVHARERIVEENELRYGAEKLEQIRLKNLKFKVQDKINEALQIIPIGKHDALTFENFVKKRKKIK